MDTELAFINAMLQNPNDESLRLVFADWLEERGDARAELLRLTHSLTQSIDIPNRPEMEARLRTLLEQGVQPIGPFWANSLGMKFAWIPPGTFLMGSPESEKGRNPPYGKADEDQHKVTLTKGFFMGVHQITQEQWRAIMGQNTGGFANKENLPVSHVSWEDCQEFIKNLRDKDHKTYRLPSEAEWEYACRPGTTTPFYFGKTVWTEYVNFNGQIGPVGSSPANAWGLYNMHGNVWEWCQDWYGEYPQGDVIDPPGPTTGEQKLLRGGCSAYHPDDDDPDEYCRSASRSKCEPDYPYYTYGLRVCFFEED